MTTTAVITMIGSIVIIWGGLGASVIALSRRSRRGRH